MDSHDTPSADFVNNFKVSHSLSKALSMERKSVATGQAEFLKKKMQQGAYVSESRRRPRPVLPSIVAEQELLCEIRRDAPGEVQAAEEVEQNKNIRLANQQSFLESRKARHHQASDSFETEMDALAERCKETAAKVSKQMRLYLEERDADVEALLRPLEDKVDLENLGEKSEEDVQELMAGLGAIIEARRTRIEALAREVEGIDHRRRQEGEKLLKRYVEACTAAAHVVPGELERDVEKRTLAMNAALLENQKSAKTLRAKLLVQTLEKSKECKVRWHRGELLWKQKRHRHSVAEVVKRIESSEFRQPDSLVGLLGRFRERQIGVFEQRKALLDECAATPLKQLSARRVRAWEEQNGALNDNAQEAWDVLLQDLKELKDGLDVQAETMLTVLSQELEIIDARQEWGEHESVNALVTADLQPPLQECLDNVKELSKDVDEALTKQDEAQHDNVVKLLAFFSALAKKQELLKKHIDDFEIEYKCKVEDCEANFENACNVKEESMHKLLNKDIAESVHHADLERVKEEAFQELDNMALLYREHALECMGIHQAYPGEVATMFQLETEGFCQELGLVTEGQILKERSEAEEAAAATGKAPPAEPEELFGWPEGDMSGNTVLLKYQVDALRRRILKVKEPVKAVAEGEVVTAAEGEETPAEAGPEMVPRFADGSEVLEKLQIEDDFLEACLERVRRTVFVQLAESRQQLDRVDVEGATEDVRRQLDHRLRKHTNRKGAVQVDVYLPRYGTISKHKDKYERHLIDIARKSRAHEDTFEKLFESIPEIEQAYCSDLIALAERFGEAGTLPMLTAIQREAIDKEDKFKQRFTKIRAELKNLATDAPSKLKKENSDFNGLCMTGQAHSVKFERVPDDEQSPLVKYSEPEIRYYAGEVAELDKALDGKIMGREDRVRELDGKVEEMRKKPFDDFLSKWQQASDELCRSKGFGREHGEPRRKAQEQCRTLNTWGADARNQIHSVTEYFDVLCGLPVDAAVTTSQLPPFKIFRLREHFVEPETGPWVFTAEVLGTLSALVCSLDSLGTHLEAFTDVHAPKFQLAKVKLVRLLQEAESEAAGDGRAVAQEQALRQASLDRLLGPLVGSEKYKSVITSVVKTAKERYASGLPAFMQTFLEDMQESAERSRLEAALGARERCHWLREVALPKLGGALFGELAARSAGSLRARADCTKAITSDTWVTSDAKRERHERALNPKLANPNNEQELVGLVHAEADRFEAALGTVVQDRGRLAACLFAEADGFVRRLAARFEVAAALVDALPLHGHFVSLPGDEEVEAQRMSIKRRMRRMQDGEAAAAQSSDALLPPRSWAGLPRYELGCMLRGGSWPEDVATAALSVEQLAEKTPAVASFRSPLHRDLYDKRNFFYQQFQKQFAAEVARRDAELSAREEKERVGDKTWYSMVKQLNPEAVEGVLEERRQAAAEAAAILAAEKAAAEAPPAKGKK